MDIIEEILNSPLLLDAPPVLLDIGASGEIHQKWQKIAKYSIGIAFDADDRDFGYAVNESKGYRKLYVFNSLVTNGATAEANFYLTRSPYCSSLLEPDHESLGRYNFGDLFEVDRIVRLKTVQLTNALREIGVNKVDWFKTDSQGTDLRLFASLGEEMTNRILVAEFEPGIIDGYKGEDKLFSLMSFMGGQPFWMNDIRICGTQRISKEATFELSARKMQPNMHVRISPCWAEVSYFNSFGLNAHYLDLRDFLLGWVFALIEGQYGFALDVALQAKQRFKEPVFETLTQYAADLISRNI
jgi:hypothetical protein